MQKELKYEDIVEHVLDIAKNRGYNASTLSRVCGVSRTSGSRWLNGSRQIAPEYLFKIINELNITILVCEVEDDMEASAWGANLLLSDEELQELEEEGLDICR